MKVPILIGKKWYFIAISYPPNICDGSIMIGFFIDINRQHGRQCYESNQEKQLLNEAIKHHI